MNAVEELFEADVRVESMFWMPSIAGCETPPSTFDEEFCKWLPDDPTHDFYTALPQLKRFADSAEYPNAEEVVNALGSVTEGFIIQAASPVRDYFGAVGAWQSSWGYYRTCWFYAPTEAAIAPILTAWAVKNNLADKAKSLAGAES